MEEMLILVNENDEEIGYAEKMETHIKEKLHRAFSLFIYNQYTNKLLIHKRASGKYHSGGLWTNSCCSHPRKGETLQTAVIRRSAYELGYVISETELTELKEVGKFQYFQRYKDCAESEIDHVFFLPISKERVELQIDESEIESVVWIDIEKLNEWLQDSPDEFSAWFPKAYKIILDEVFAINKY